MSKKDSKKVFQLALNEINNSDDPTKVECSFIILDFEQSLNNTIISKEDALDGLAQSIVSKPIVCHYNPTDKDNPNDDSLEGHNAYIDENKHGELIIEMDTTPIGVFTSEGYVGTIQVDGKDHEVLMADAILWKDRFSEAVELLQEWNSRGININTSCELLYSNYEVKDSIEHIKSPIYFSGHCLLNSEERGDQPVILPAYQSSKLVSFNEQEQFKMLVAQAINQSNKKEDEKMPEKFKKVFELSHDDIRSRLYRELDVNLHEDEYSWVVDVYDNEFIVNIFGNGSDKYYKYNYTKSETDVEIDYDSKNEVVEERKWVKLEEVKNLQAQVEEKDETIQSLNSEKESLVSEKEELQTKFNESSDKLVSLSSEVEELSEYKKKFDQVQFDAKLEEKQELYSAKFSALNATESYESEDVQKLVEKSVSSEDAVMQLNSMIVDLVMAKKEDDKEKNIVQLNNKRQNLVPTETDFDSRYK